MNKSNLFKIAHKITKKVIKTGDNYRVTFSAAIKVALDLGKKYAVATVTNADKLAKILENKFIAEFWGKGSSLGYNRYYLSSKDITVKAFIDLDLGAIFVDGTKEDMELVISTIKRVINK